MKCQHCPTRDIPAACIGEANAEWCGSQPGDLFKAHLLRRTCQLAAGGQTPPAPETRVRVGLLAPCLHHGGAESWMLALARFTDPSRIQWVGCVVTGPPGAIDPPMAAKMRALMPLDVGREAAKALAARSDVLVTWAIDGLGELARSAPTPPKVVSCVHAPIDSPWGQTVYARPDGIDRWVAVSELARHAIPDASAKAAPVSVIWNAVDTDRLRVSRPREEMRRAWGVPEGSLVAGYLGRLSEEKDPLAMVRMAPHLPGPWVAVAVGAGGHGDEMARAIRDGLGGRLFLPGPDPAAGDVLNAFDVLLVPSDYESFGLTLAEGLWAGLPVVSTDVGVARLRPGLTRPIPLRADGPTLAAAVLEAHRLGPMPGSRDFARERMSPERFGREWDRLILELAAPKRRADPTPAQLDARLAVRRGKCPHATRPDGCGCSGEVLCGLGRGTGGRASFEDCKACLRASPEDVDLGRGPQPDHAVPPLQAQPGPAGTPLAPQARLVQVPRDPAVRGERDARPVVPAGPARPFAGAEVQAGPVPFAVGQGARQGRDRHPGQQPPDGPAHPKKVSHAGSSKPAPFNWGGRP